MTEENYKYRTSSLLLRNQFKGEGTLQIPIVPKFQAKEDDFTGLRLIGFDKTKPKDNNHLDRMVHFFLYDYKFERVWKDPDTDLEKLKRYRAVFTPDFSMYTTMAPAMQLYNTFRNRWCGAYYASKGIRVIPTVSWGNENTFAFCFDGIEKGSTVALSTYMVSAHNNHSDQKDFFLKGYREMLRQIEPERIICYNEPFPEMQGNIVFVDYDLSSWRHMNDDPDAPSEYAKYICGKEPWPDNCDIIRKTGYIPRDSFYIKGMGNPEGGKWRPSPNKPHDARFLGEPGEIKTIYDGQTETKIGEDGRAIKERHWSDHNQPWKHTIPHDHEIDWSPGYPDPGPAINYRDGNIPEFKSFREVMRDMSESMIMGQDKNLNFESISDFKWCMKCHGEVEFEYNGKGFSITPEQTGEIGISEAFKQETEKICKDADEVLEYIIDGVRLREIITKVEVMFRSI